MLLHCADSGCKIFCLPVCYPKLSRLHIQKYSSAYCVVWVRYLVDGIGEGCRMRVFENRALRIFGPRRDEVKGEWRKLHNEELNDLYCSHSIVRVIE